MKTRRPARHRNLRLAQAVVAQAPRSLRFDLTAALAPAHALVTGGNKGIGAAVASRLRDFGTDVVVAARDVDGAAGNVRIDLADLDQVAAGADRAVAGLGGRPFDLVVLNAGVAPTRMARSAQGHELAFATNVLGHHVLFQRLRHSDAIAPGARIVVVTGDILMLARSCTPDFTSDHPRAGTMAYARSKLGLLWLATEQADRAPDLHVVAVHPGVVRSGLGGDGLRRRSERVTHISPERSSRTVLAAACSPDVPSGAYVHNTLGLVRLRADDPAADRERAAAFVDLLDELAAPWLPGAGATASAG